MAFEALAITTAMPVVAQDLGGVREYGLAFSLFLTTALFGTVAAGGWNDARGPRGPVLAGLGLFVAGLAVSGAAQTYPQLLVGRVVSGAGAGVVVVSLYVAVARAFPDALRPRVFGWLAAAWVLPSVVGPPLAGTVATELTWRLVFVGVVPFALVAGVVLLPTLERAASGPAARTAAAAGAPRGTRGDRARVLRGAALALGAGVLVWAAQRPDPVDATGGAAAAAGLAAVAVALPPLLPAGTLRAARGLPAVIGGRGLMTASFLGAEAFVPLMLVTERGLAPAVAGLTLTGAALGWAAGAAVQGRRREGDRHRLLVAGGLFTGGAVAALLPALSDAVPPAVVVPAWALAGLGMGLSTSTSSVLTLRLSPVAEQGRNSAALHVSDSLGGVVGIGVSGAVFAALHDPAGSDAAGFATLWVLAAVFALAAAAVGVRARPPAAGERVASGPPGGAAATLGGPPATTAGGAPGAARPGTSPERLG